MSQAFVREGDDQWLPDVGPSLNALIIFLTRENGGIRVYEQKNFTGTDGRQVHAMSNGLLYAKDSKGKWEVVPPHPPAPRRGRRPARKHSSTFGCDFLLLATCYSLLASKLLCQQLLEIIS